MNSNDHDNNQHPSDEALHHNIRLDYRDTCRPDRTLPGSPSSPQQTSPRTDLHARLSSASFGTSHDLPAVAIDATGKTDGHQWGELMSASGEFRWPPVGIFSWPPSQRLRAGAIAQAAHELVASQQSTMQAKVEALTSDDGLRMCLV